MDWQDVKSAWDQLGERIQDNWPETRSDDLMRIAGDRSNFADYLARAHDLTRAEAGEAIDDWLLRMRNVRVLEPSD